MSELKLLPLIVLKKQILIPQTLLDFELSHTWDEKAAKKVVQNCKYAFLAMEAEDGQGVALDGIVVNPVGTVADIRRVMKLPNNQNRVLTFGLQRARLESFEERDGLMHAWVEECEATELFVSEPEEAAMRTFMLELIGKFLEAVGKGNGEILKSFTKAKRLSDLIAQATAAMPIDKNTKQQVLAAESVYEQYHVFMERLNYEFLVLKETRRLREKLQSSLEKAQREHMMREQIRIIREELGEGGPEKEADKFRAQLQEKHMPDETRASILAEIDRYATLGSNNPESSVMRTYLETLMKLPWDSGSPENWNLRQCEQQLARDHYGMEEIKSHVCEFLAVYRRKGMSEGTILCLVGPPGTGKTSIAKSIAEAMGRTYHRICLGGVRDEAEIRGHRKTYIGAMPGRLVKALTDTKTNNPLILLDEIDKLGSDHRGDPASALLEALDPEQNVRFVDHYIELPVDLSKAFFIATANSLDTIPRPLLDRMEVLQLSTYTAEEKLQIATKYLLPKQMKRAGLGKAQLSIGKKAIEAIISGYTRESGVRSLERRLGTICRKTVLEITRREEAGETPERVKVTEKDLERLLGPGRYPEQRKHAKPEIGLVHGLAWTSVGGTTLDIEVNTMPGKGELLLTGKLGEVMQESARIAITFVRSVLERYDVTSAYFSEHDVHIHIAEGAVPKDGPSAGITLATAILSAVSRIPVRQDVAMTGELTLRGRVLPIGGLKEKLLAAKAAGIRLVLIPENNAADYHELPEEVKAGLTVVTVSHMDEVLRQALDGA